MVCFVFECNPALRKKKIITRNKNKIDGRYLCKVCKRERKITKTLSAASGIQKSDKVKDLADGRTAARWRGVGWSVVSGELGILPLPARCYAMERTRAGLAASNRSHISNPKILNLILALPFCPICFKIAFILVTFYTKSEACAACARVCARTKGSSVLARIVYVPTTYVPIKVLRHEFILIYINRRRSPTPPLHTQSTPNIPNPLHINDSRSRTLIGVNYFSVTGVTRLPSSFFAEPPPPSRPRLTN